MTGEEPPYQGIRHQCGGTVDISITGDALGNAVDEDIYIDFGPNISGDSYEHPLVAACCAEYDFDQLASSQPNYWENCLYDAIQQFCSALPYYVWDMAATAKAAKEFVIADQLIKLGNDLATSESQYECIETLWGGGPTEYFNFITDRHWNPAYDVWVNIDSLEVIEVSLPEDPDDWLTCKSIFENDETIIPDIEPGPVWDTLEFDAGALQLSGTDFQVTLAPDGTSEVLLGHGPNGAMLLGALQLYGGPVAVEGVEIERWRIGSFRAYELLAAHDGTFSVPAGTLYLVAAAVVEGDTLSVSATNATPVVLRKTEVGWVLEALSLVYTLDNGDAWTLDSSALDFDLR